MALALCHHKMFAHCELLCIDLLKLSITLLTDSVPFFVRVNAYTNPHVAKLEVPSPTAFLFQHAAVLQPNDVVAKLCMMTATAGLLFIAREFAKANGRANDLADRMADGGEGLAKAGVGLQDTVLALQ